MQADPTDPYCCVAKVGNNRMRRQAHHSLHTGGQGAVNKEEQKRMDRHRHAKSLSSAKLLQSSTNASL